MQIDDVRDESDLLTPRTQLTFGVLGPLEVRTGDGLLHVGGPRIRALLALLLIRPGQVMSLSTLVASLWSGDAPPSAERTARTYVSRLRLALAPVTDRAGAGPLIVTAPPGYLLRTDPMSVDAAVFEQLTAAGRRALTRDDPVTARSHLRKALRLWRGDAFAEFADVPLLRAEAGRLEELRLSAVENRLQSELWMGLGPDLVAELDGLVASHPLRERLWVQFMTALYRSGRQAEALSAYQRARTLLADELGLEPSVELADTHRKILAQDPKLLLAAGSATGVRERAAGRAGSDLSAGPRGTAAKAAQSKSEPSQPVPEPGQAEAKLIRPVPEFSQPEPEFSPEPELSPIPELSPVPELSQPEGETPAAALAGAPVAPPCSQAAPAPSQAATPPAPVAAPSQGEPAPSQGEPAPSQAAPAPSLAAATAARCGSRPAGPPTWVYWLPEVLRPAAAAVVSALPCVRVLAGDLARKLTVLGRAVAACASVIAGRVLTCGGWRSGDSLADMK